MKPSDWKSNWVGLAAGMRGGPKAVKIKTLQLGEQEAGAGCKPTIHISHEGRERIFFLTTPFIGPLRRHHRDIPPPVLHRSAEFGAGSGRSVQRTGGCPTGAHRLR